MAAITTSYPRTVRWVDYNGYRFEDGTPAPADSTSSQVTSWSNSRTSISNPEFRKQIARGNNATTPMTGTKRTFLPAGQYVQWTIKNSSFYPSKRQVNYHGGALGLVYTNTFPVDPTGISTVKANERAVVHAYRDIQKINEAFQGQIFLGELGEALRMIKGRTRSFYRGLFSFAGDAKKRTRRVKKVTKKNAILSGLWLEYSFGWVPLISDTKNIIEAVTKSNYYRGDSVAFKAVGYSGESISHENGSMITPPIEYTWTTKTEAWVNIYGRVGVTMQTTDILSKEYWGFSLSSFLPTVWELTPYSFLVDYFSNVGDIVNAWSVPLSNVRWMSRSVRQKSSRDLTRLEFREKYMSGQSYYYKGTGFVQRVPMGSSRLSINRQRDYTLETPSLRFEIPGLSMKWLNIGALGRIKSLR